MTSGHAGTQVLARRWKYPAPPWRMHEALVDEHSNWLQPWDDERSPSVVEASTDRVVFSPWVHEDIDIVEVLIATDGGSGSQLTVVLRGPVELAAVRRKEVRYRLGTLFGGALRDWIEPY